ncbi:glycosyltransferase involved in cell wall biosynthesis [Parabacteroides sp. PH5-13]|uniref:glycosyltransferase family 2 protein n=1 Tax=unclassified Parabacteroides TaxID=2649774 RepID=UPI002476CBB5|nr:MULTISPECIES: glycosyltransferase family 2 protein [unclassified Parabacteroides]MDH6305586.1 glycosyltransferase involved in cell wall biosynthesis [Parabacteroides sp. PH5-39]MDH6319859.1 glycosyltransferase involved in cell wall biosynthesis [Parabacteroides sp. PH5-13]MDH6323550.1 glycosyltransferase involved in cell wall biosynthesis [Parabacteroides sp. PH5-8]MDH6384662.1 glycosyltransferase involved in cell wall biosynthesis [Parabacteroides sp. PH5-17]MDH6394017.1 glycosyltransferas
MGISVIIPVYNVERYIERCIKSILNQTYQDFEIVLVDDKGTDQSMKIVEKYSQKDDRFVVVNNLENMGSMWARMIGYKNAKGQYFVFCDSDDFLPSNALEILYKEIIFSKAEIVIGNIQYVLNEENKRNILKNKLSFGADSEAVYKSLLVGELSHSLCAKIYDRVLFDKYEYETFKNQTHGEDGMLFYQLISNLKRVTLINDVVYYYYINEESATRSKITDEKLQKISFSSDYIFNYVSNIQPKLNHFLIHRKIITLTTLLNAGVSKQKIQYYSKTLDVNYLLKFDTLSRFYNGIDFVLIYLFLNSRMLRKIKRLVLSVKK